MTTITTISKSRRTVSQPDVSSTETPTVMLAGNPNAGKTNLFNALTGLRQKVANYPGVTVERVEGRWTLPALDASSDGASDFRASSNGDKSSNAKKSNGFHSNNHLASNALFSATNETETIEVASLNDVRLLDDNQVPSEKITARVIDLPGLYSLDALSPDELIARKCLAGEMQDLAAPDCIVAVVDATNLERNLFLVTQLLDFDSPLVVALTMFDLAQKRGLEIDIEKLSARLSVPVVPVVVSERRGLTELARAVRSQISSAIHQDKTFFAAKHFAWRDAISSNGDASSHDSSVWQDAIARRYKWIEATVAESVGSKDKPVGQSAKSSTQLRSKKAESPHDMTSRIDRWATHKVFGLLIFLAVMLLVFQAIFAWATLPMELIDNGFGTLGEAVRATLPTGLLTDLLVDGIIAGVGGVLVFLPQISLLFLFIALLEDTGYMARAAFLMDRLMRAAGLHGKAFVPLLSSFACAIPGIMATRTIENPRDRIATILIAPLMSCSARLPVYTLMIAAFFADRKVFGFLSLGAIIIMAMYALGIVTAIVVALLLKRTVLRAPVPPLVMEMPPYRAPHLPTILQTVWTRAFMFVRRAGTIILAISIILWALVTFPRTTVDDISTATNIEAGQSIAPNDEALNDERAKLETARAVVAQATRETGMEAQGETAPQIAESGDHAQISNEAGAQLRNSFAGRFGHFIEPVIAPLGFEWRTGIGLIASFAAREVFVSTMSIVYNVGADKGEEPPSLIDAFHNARRADGSPVWTPLTAVSLMVFFVLACQCMSTVAITRRETNSWKWAMFMVVYMLVLAYAASFIVYQGGRLLGYS